jgi:flagellin
MSLVVNYNAMAFNAHRNLQGTSKSLAGSVEKLSSGLRVNSAADDPAGLVISEYMRAQSEGLGQAVRNANDGINLVKTAEAALNEVHNLLRQMRTLSLHAANAGANSDEAIAADDAAVQKAVESIDRIATNTKFNGLTLLDGNYSKDFQIGANSGETATLSIDSIASDDLGVDSIDLTSDAQQAIDDIDDAIQSVSDIRTELGSFQRYTLETTVSSLTIAQENIRASESTIRDADVAAEMVTFTRNNIMLQAGTAMLAQANQAPQQVLSLIR